MNKKFPVLSLIAQILRIVGWIAVVIGVVALAYGIYQLAGAHSTGFRRISSDDAIIAASSGIGAVILGLCWVAAGELIGVLFAIEGNTRANRSEAFHVQGAEPMSRA